MKAALTILALLALSIALAVAAYVALDRTGAAIREELNGRESQIERYMHPSDSSVSIDTSTLTPPSFTYYWSCGPNVVCYDEG
jgi:hypothetical protein